MRGTLRATIASAAVRTGGGLLIALALVVGTSVAGPVGLVFFLPLVRSRVLRLRQRVVVPGDRLMKRLQLRDGVENEGSLVYRHLPERAAQRGLVERIARRGRACLRLKYFSEKRHHLILFSGANHKAQAMRRQVVAHYGSGTFRLSFTHHSDRGPKPCLIAHHHQRRDRGGPDHLELQRRRGIKEIGKEDDRDCCPAAQA